MENNSIKRGTFIHGIAASQSLDSSGERIDIAGVDIIFDRKKEEYIVLEVNGIPAFATPEQEKMGLNCNDKKIDLIVDLIDRKTIKKENEK